MAAAVLLLWLNRDQWFFADEWAFITDRMEGWGRELLAPHNEHWVSSPVLVYRAAFAAVGLRSYLPYVAVLVLLHVTVSHLLWRTMLRSGVRPLVATSLSAVFAVLGTGFENLLSAFQMGFVGSLALGLVQLILVDHGSPFGRRDVLAWVVGVVGLTFSGVGVTMVLVVGVAVLLRRGLRSAAVAVSVPAVTYLAWFQLFGREGVPSHDLTAEIVLQLPAYVWNGLSQSLGRASGVEVAGPVLVIVITVWVVRRLGARAVEQAVPLALAAGAVAFFAVVAVGRPTGGGEHATAVRYVYVTVALVVPAVGVMLSEMTRGSTGRLAAVVVILGLVLLHNLSELTAMARVESQRELGVQRRIRAAVGLARSGAALVDSVPEPTYSPNLTLGRLLELERRGALPEGVSVDEADVLGAAAGLQVATSAAPLLPLTGDRPRVVRTDGASVSGDGDCARVTPTGRLDPTVEVSFASPASFSVRASRGGALHLALRSSPASPALGSPRALALAPGAPQWVNVSRDSGSIVMVLASKGPTELCAVTPPDGEAARRALRRHA